VTGMNVLVTGAAMGMGRLFAERAVAEGARALVLWDVDAAALEATAAALRTGDTAVHAFTLDLADAGAVTETAERVRREVGDIDVLFNNAGIVRGKPFLEHTHDDIERTMAVNATAPMHVARAFLPAMVANRRPARLVTMASAAGYVSNPRMSVYAGSKWAVTGWSDSVRLELELAGHHHVRVTTVNPTYVGTGMFAGAGTMPLTPLLSPERVVARTWQAMLDGRPRLVMPWPVHLSTALRALLPVRAFDWLALHVLRIYKSMDSFTGRT
jgi:all-trans-retinol dehydrogenase (NAD+)